MTKKIILITLIIILNFNLKSNAEIIFNKKNAVEAGISFEYANSSSYYDMNGDITVSLQDTVLATIQNKYIFEFRKYSIGVHIEYSILDDLGIYIKIPFNYYSLDEKYLKDSNGFYPIDSDSNFITRPSYSLFKPGYYALGANYLLFSNIAFGVANLELRIPPGFHNGILNDPDYPFLSDGAFEILVGIDFGARFKKGSIEAGILYNYRDEELADQIIFSTEAALSTVENTRLFVKGKYVQSLKSFDNPIPFDPRRTTIQEDYFSAGFGFGFKISNQFKTELFYDVWLMGKNSMSLGKLGINMDFILK